MQQSEIFKVKFSTEMKSDTGLSLFRLSCERTLNMISGKNYISFEQLYIVQLFNASICLNVQETAYLVKFTGEILASF